MHMRFLSRGFKNLQWYGMTNRYWTNTYFFSGGFAVKCSL